MAKMTMTIFDRVDYRADEITFSYICLHIEYKKKV